MELDLKGRIALITGGSRGIGYGVAEALTAQYGVKVTVHALDLSTQDNAIKLVKACGPLDILINNAGAIPQGTITGLDDKTWREAWDLKVFGFINVTREVYRDMCAKKRGVIVNVVGIAGERPAANYIAGSMANAGLMA